MYFLSFLQCYQKHDFILDYTFYYCTSFFSFVVIIICLLWFTITIYLLYNFLKYFLNYSIKCRCIHKSLLVQHSGVVWMIYAVQNGRPCDKSHCNVIQLANTNTIIPSSQAGTSYVQGQLFKYYIYSLFHCIAIEA